MDIFYVGLDWGSEKHAVCVTTSEGVVLAERELRNEAAFLAIVSGLVGGNLTRCRIAVESRELPLVDMLVEAGCAVFTVNPKQADKFRDRYTAGGAKDDRRDAHVLARALRTDEAAFRLVKASSEAEAMLRLCVRAVADAEAQFRLAANQLRAVLSRYFPAVLTLCDGADERWLWRLLERAPDPDAAAKLSTKTLEALLRACQVRRIEAAELRAVLKGNELRASSGVTAACVDQVQRLVERLVLLRSHRIAAEKQRDKAVARLHEEQRATSEASDVELIRSMPGAGAMVVATLLGEACDAVRTRDLEALRAISGVAPITKRSGKMRVVVMRRARNGALANALFHAARVASMNDDRFRAQLASLRGPGRSYARAVRGVADRWLTILFAVLRDRTPYEPTHARKQQPKAA